MNRIIDPDRDPGDEAQEPQDYERFSLTPEQEVEFEKLARRLVPSIEKEPF